MMRKQQLAVSLSEVGNGCSFKYTASFPTSLKLTMDTCLFIFH